ncbi:hypothetical protein BDB01DRAFT_840457 [Pilobolus umbonatus]|nr:hypothetical protein BDB01DRAFT_840457 [Pilobolus umbonatus]
MVLKFLRMGIVTFVLYSLVAIPILFPINTINQGTLQGLNYLTLGNVIDDRRTWAHCLLAVSLTGLVWYYTFHQTKIYILLRRKYLLSPDYADTVVARTVLIPSIPEYVNNANDLYRIFSKFPGGVRRIWLNRRLDDLPELVDERQKMVDGLEKTITKAILTTYNHYMKQENKTAPEEGLENSFIPDKNRPTHRESVLPIPLPCFGEKVDTIHFYHRKIKELNEVIEEKQENLQSMQQVNSAFIEFNQQVAAHMAAQSLISKESLQMSPRYIQVAPSDIIWENMNIKPLERLVRRVLSITITVVIIIFWAIPVTFVQAIANLQKLSEAIPFLSAIEKLGPTAVGIIQGILPAVALAILISLVPTIFAFLSRNEGIPQRSFVDLSVLHKFFFFQLIDVVLVSTIAGGALSMATEYANLLQNPFDIVNKLSTNLPQASTFFITYVMLQSTNQSGQTMLQIVPFLLSYIFPLLASTPRRKYNQKITCPNINLGTLVPGHSIIFILGLEYGVISPLILPFTCLFFGLQYFVYLYQFLYVYENGYETAGRHFPRAIRHIYIGLIISHLTLIGLFAIRSGGLGQMGVMIALFIINIFVMSYYTKAFKPLFKYIPICSFDEDENKKKLNVNDVDKFRASFVAADGASGSRKTAASDGIEVSMSEGSRDNSLRAKSRAPVNDSSIENDENAGEACEAYANRALLLDKLKSEEKKDKEVIKKDSEFIMATAKLLYDVESYMHPSTYNPKPTIWLPEDDLGITDQEIKELEEMGIDGSSRNAAILRNEKGKGRVTIDKKKLIDENEGVPGSLSGQRTDLNNYIRVLVDNFNFFDAVTMY